MAKSITGGLGAVNLTIQELRLLEISSTTLTTTDATILNNLTGKNATFSGTVTIENLSIENATVDNLTVNVSLNATDITASGTITANNITANNITANDITTSATITANGNVVINSLLVNNTDNNERYIPFQGLGNVLHRDTKLTFNPFTNTLTIFTLSCEDINATGTMVLENGQITNATIALGNIAIANITDANINATSRNDDVEYKIVLLRASDNRICEDSGNNITYNPLNNRLSVNNVTISQQLTIPPLVATSSTDFNITFLNSNDQFRIGGITRPLTFNPSSGILKSYDLELSNDLTVTGRTDLGAIVTINSLNSVITNTTYPLLIWDNTNTISRTIRVDIPNLYYDTTDNTLYAPNFSGNVSIVVQTRSNTTNYPVLFYDTTTNQICIDSTTTQFTYNPDPLNNRLTVPNLTINDGLTINADAEINTDHDLYFREINQNLPGDKGVIFWENIGRIIGRKSAGLNGELHLVTEAARQFIDYQISLQGSRTNLNSTNDIFFRINNNSKVEITSTMMTINNDVTINGSLSISSFSIPILNTTTVNATDINATNNLSVGNDATITGDTTITAVNSTVSNNNRIPFIEGGGATGRLCESNLYYNPNNQTLVSANITTTNAVNSPVVTVTGTNNGQLTIDPTYGLFYNQADGHVFRILGAWKLRIDTTLTTIYEDLQCQQNLTVNGSFFVTPTVPTVSSNFQVLLHNSGTNEVKKSNSNFTHDPINEIVTVPKLALKFTSTPSTNADYPILFKNLADTIVATDNESGTNVFTYNPGTNTLKVAKMIIETIDNASNDSKITVQQPLRYGSGLFSQPLNYTIRIGHTDNIRTINITGGLNNGAWGGGNVLSILKSGTKATSYGQDSKLWSYNAYVDATNTPTNFTMAGLPGLWDVKVSCLYEASPASTSNRVNPILRGILNNTTTINEGAESNYVRQQLGRVITVTWHNKLYFDTSDFIGFRTYANYAGTNDFSSVINGADYTVTDFMFMATYLGPLNEYDQTEP